jgi:hypothetical protein
MGVNEFDEPIVIVSSEFSFLLDCIFFFSCYPLSVRYLLKFMQYMVNLMNGDD